VRVTKRRKERRGGRGVNSRGECEQSGEENKGVRVATRTVK
jgi:hypothetical protein